MLCAVSCGGTHLVRRAVFSTVSAPHSVSCQSDFHFPDACVSCRLWCARMALQTLGWARSRTTPPSLPPPPLLMGSVACIVSHLLTPLLLLYCTARTLPRDVVVSTLSVGSIPHTPSVSLSVSMSLPFIVPCSPSRSRRLPLSVGIGLERLLPLCPCSFAVCVSPIWCGQDRPPAPLSLLPLWRSSSTPGWARTRWPMGAPSTSWGECAPPPHPLPHPKFLTLPILLTCCLLLAIAFVVVGCPCLWWWGVICRSRPFRPLVFV
jgi:hypothetical protein